MYSIFIVPHKDGSFTESLQTIYPLFFFVKQLRIKQTMSHKLERIYSKFRKKGIH